MKYIQMASAIIASALACNAVAAVSSEEAKQLGGSRLTAWGAEKAGNKDGSIPEFTDIPIKAPASWDPKNPGQHPDPFNEKPLFAITAQNQAQYADKLTEGQKTLFKTYPNWRMDIYPTHRTAAYPKTVIDNTIKNATSCKALDQELRLEGCYGGFPFPVPKTGAEVVWNHLMAPSSFSTEGNSAGYVVPQTGAPVLQSNNHTVQEFSMYNPAKTGVAEPKEIFWKARVDELGPARRVGQKLVVIDALDQLNVGRRAYQYIPGQRRVKLAPDLAYDTPLPYAGGVATIDEQKLFLGSLDRYSWKLEGKQEKYIIHNNFLASDFKICPDEKVTSTKRFPNPDCLRWELHRVWVVTGTLKPGFRHVYAKRTLYLDEDSYAAGITDQYDAGGKLYKITMAMHFTLYEQVGAVNADSTNTLDLNTGTYYITGIGSKDGGWWVSKPKDAFFFSPEALAGEGIR